MEQQRPILILTAQRCGGTALAEHLSTQPGAKAFAHEPFNPRRRFGPIAAAFTRDAEGERLVQALDGICASSLSIKHCIEIEPFALTEALADACLRAGYRLVLLYRRDGAARLLSRHFAMRTGIWSPDMAYFERISFETERPADLPPRGADGPAIAALPETIRAEPLPVARLVALERECRQRFLALYSRIKAASSGFAAIDFETLFLAPIQEALAKAEELHAFTGGAGDWPDPAAWLAGLRGWGEQGTRPLYQEFAGSEALHAELAGLGAFALPPSPETGPRGH